MVDAVQGQMASLLESLKAADNTTRQQAET